MNQSIYLYEYKGSNQIILNKKQVKLSENIINIIIEYSNQKEIKNIYNNILKESNINNIKIKNKDNAKIISNQFENKLESEKNQKINLNCGNKSKNKLIKKIKNNFLLEKIIHEILKNIILKYFMIINLIFPILTKEIKILSSRRLVASSEITIKINSNGMQSIFNNAFTCPDEIYVNGNLVGNNLCSITLEDQENVIKMKWNDKIFKNCNNMFKGLNKIEEIDLSMFDTSLVTNMENMFYGCSSLKSINFQNVKTSLVESMANMFYTCTKLESLNLSDFDTSSVITMNHMFSYCSSITSINVSSFDTSLVKDMNNMFGACRLLDSIDISNFKTSLVTDMSSMFLGCNSLTSLDLLHINTSLVTSMNYMFSGCYLLTSLNLSHFKTSLVTKMNNMFRKCSSLKSLDLSYFDTSLVEEMKLMFSECTQLSSINLSSFNTAKVSSMSKMFYKCESLKEIDLSNFDISSVITVDNMFYSCSSLKSLDISNFKKSLITNAENMFSDCNSLIFLNLTNFDISNAYQINSMFSGCKSLKSLDLSTLNSSSLENTESMFSNCNSLISLYFGNFDTSKITSMKNMFFGCTSLTSLNLSSFDTSNVKTMLDMFNNCNSLKSLDLSNFNTSKTTSLYRMFYNCTNLQYINLSNFEVSSSTSTNYMFDLTPENLVICLNNNSQIIMNLIAQKQCSNIDCSNNWRENQTKLIAIENTCIDQCGGESKYIYEYESRCYEECPSGTHPNNSFCEIDEIQILESDIIDSDESDKIWQNDNNTNKSDDLSYYNENDKNIKSNDIVKENENFQNLYESQKLDKFFCHAKEFFFNTCKAKIENNEDKKEFTQNIINEILDGKMNEVLQMILSGKQSITIEEKSEIYQISTLSSQMNIENNNLSSIDFGECENILRKQYHIDNNKELIILKIENYIDGYSIPILDYAIFTEDGKIRLDLDYCKDLSIIYNIPVSINENEIYKYDPESDYYNNICKPFSTDNKTDITIYDRKNEYNDNNMSLCEINCTYKGYDSIKKKVECECPIKSNFLFLTDIYIDKDKLFDKFINIKSITNFIILKCYKLLFSTNGLISNIGSYILLSIIFITSIESILFCIKGYSSLHNRIKNIIQINFKNNNDVFKEKKLDKKVIKPIKRKGNNKLKVITSIYSPPKTKNKKNLKKSKNKIKSRISLTNATTNSRNISSKNNILVQKKNKKTVSLFIESPKNNIKDKTIG